jgi:hypothetical protein
MSEFVQIKQVENLADQLAKIPEIKQIADDASLIANEVKTTLQNLQISGARAKEVFSGITSAANTKVQLQLANTIANDVDVQVFFNGILITKSSSPVGGNVLDFMVPYATEPTDTIIVYYII